MRSPKIYTSVSGEVYPLATNDSPDNEKPPYYTYTFKLSHILFQLRNSSLETLICLLKTLVFTFVNKRTLTGTPTLGN